MRRFGRRAWVSRGGGGGGSVLELMQRPGRVRCATRSHGRDYHGRSMADLAIPSDFAQDAAIPRRSRSTVALGAAKAIASQQAPPPNAWICQQSREEKSHEREDRSRCGTKPRGPQQGCFNSWGNQGIERNGKSGQANAYPIGRRPRIREQIGRKSYWSSQRSDFKISGR
jgi:hypothetical protein